ncbi:MAG: flagellar hook-basal body complex protein [Oscillospiraceae bacterium]|jgi:flagellar hook-basal body protein|nr:flagellar hook-basal body complex protein [Oscillospiraceae bacterium]
MMKSLYSGVSGLKVHNQRMDVIGNNIANVNTTGYKTSTVTFRDVFYQTKQNSSSGNNASGGLNPKQVGYGAKLGSINQVMTQSGFTYSDSVYDVALSGDGFFQVMDNSGAIYYTRNGLFNVDDYGNLVDSNGYIVLGVRGDPTGVDASSQRIHLDIPAVQNSQASAYKEIEGYGITIKAPGYGPDGNISVTFTQSPVPFATLNGTNLTVQLDLTRSFANGDEFEAAVNAAIRAGGVNLPDTVIPLEIEFDSTPPDTASQTAQNTMEFLNPDGTVKGYWEFEAITPGVYANAYEIDVKTSETATVPVARWAGNVMTITVPGAVDKNMYKTNPSLDVSDFTSANYDPTSQYYDIELDVSNPGTPANPNPLYNTGSPDYNIKADSGLTIQQGYDPTYKKTIPNNKYMQPIYDFSLADVQAAVNKAAGMTLNTTTTPPQWEGGDENKYIQVKNYAFNAGQNTWVVDDYYDDGTALKIGIIDPSTKTDNVVVNNPSLDVSRRGTVANPNPLYDTTSPLYDIELDVSDPTSANYDLTSIYYNEKFDSTSGNYDPTYKRTVDFETWNANEVITPNIKRVGLADGSDNFYSRMAKALQTVPLQDGRFAAEQTVADLTTIQIDNDGTIYGDHPVHGELILGRIDITTFENPGGLEQIGTSYWIQSRGSGPAQVKRAGIDGAATVVQGALEMSNVDLAQEFSDMIITQRGFQANSRIITVSDTMLEELINLKR